MFGADIQIEEVRSLADVWNLQIQEILFQLQSGKRQVADSELYNVSHKTPSEKVSHKIFSIFCAFEIAHQSNKSQ
jgi:hypothetical protein